MLLPAVAVADKGIANSFRQYGTGVLTKGAAGVNVMVIVIGVLGPSQPPTVAWLT